MSPFKLLSRDDVRGLNCGKENFLSMESVPPNSDLYKLCLYPEKEDFSISRYLRESGYWELGRYRWFSKLLAERERIGRSTMIDVGAHLGIFGFQAASTGAKVICIEPKLTSAQKILLGVRENNWDDRVFVLQNVAADYLFKAQLMNVPRDPAYVIVTEKIGENDHLGMQSVILDDLVDLGLVEPKDIYLIKIDTGALWDINVMNGMKKILTQGRPPYINIEGSTFPPDRCNALEFFTFMMQTLQYTCFDDQKPVQFETLVSRIQKMGTGTPQFADLSFIAQGFPSFFREEP